METRSNSNQHLIECMLAVGYKPNSGGVCLAITLTTTQAILSDKFEHYQKKINYILSHQATDLSIQIKNAKMQKQIKEETDLTEKEIFILEIDKLLFNLMIHSNPSEVDPSLFGEGKKTTSQITKRTLPVTQPARLNLFYLGGFAFSFGAFGSWPSREVKLKEYLFSLKQVAPNITFTICIENLEHTILLAYHADKQAWSITDSEKLPTKIIEHEEELSIEAYKSFQAFDDPSNYIFISRVYFNSPSNETIQALQKWKVEQHQKVFSMINTFSNDEKTYLLHIASGGDIEMVKALHGKINYNLKLDDTTAIYRAASYDEPEIVKLLLSYHANPNLGYSDGLSPLIIACENGCEKVVKLLLSHDADSIAQCEDGSFPLLAAVECENTAITDLLLTKNLIKLPKESINELLETLELTKNQTLKNKVKRFLELNIPHSQSQETNLMLNSNSINLTHFDMTLFSNDLQIDPNQSNKEKLNNSSI